jgi:outer membrane biosynthesis protein TonB
MREKSQIDDMRAALRGDLERARARREEDPWRQSSPQPPVVPQPDPDVLPTPEPDPPPEPDVLPEPDPEPATPPDPAPAPELPPEPDPQPAPAASRRGFFARLFGRN